jgi:DNA-binding CsgD family transcriptional regulator
MDQTDTDKLVGARREGSRWLVRDRTFRRYPHINKQLLTELYLVQELSTVEIAKRLKVSRNVVLEYMEMHGIERRHPGEAGAMKSRVYQIDEQHFERIDEADKAYIVGFILGDGTLVDRGKSKRLVLSVADGDGVLLERIAERLNCADLVQRELRPNAPTEQPKAKLVVNSTRLVNDLVTLGVPLSPKSGREPFIEFATPELTWAFIRGVSDADGCIRVYERSNIVNGEFRGRYRRARWSVTIGKPFVYGLRDFLERNGIQLRPSCIQPKQGTGLLEVADQQKIRRIAQHMYQDGTLWLQRKKDIFDKLG